MKKVKVAVIGVGLIGYRHALCLKLYPKAELTAVCDIDRRRAEEVAGELSVPKTYYDFESLVQDPEVDAVIVATPDHLHRDPVVAALEAGKHVLCEKPLAVDTGEAEEMVKAAEKSGRILTVDFHNRWNPPYALLKEKADSGELGRPVHAYLKLNDTIYVPTKMLRWASKSSPLWFLGSHIVDLALWITGGSPCEVYGYSSKGILESMGVDTVDYYQYMLRFTEGFTVLLENSWVLPETLPSIVDFKSNFVFTNASVYIDTHQHNAFRVYTSTRASNPDLFCGPYQIHGRLRGFAKEPVYHFVDCIAEDREPLVKPEDGLKVTKILEAVEESARNGRPIRLA